MWQQLELFNDQDTPETYENKLQPNLSRSKLLKHNFFSKTSKDIVEVPLKDIERHRWIPSETSKKCHFLAFSRCDCADELLNDSPAVGQHLDVAKMRRVHFRPIFAVDRSLGILRPPREEVALYVTFCWRLWQEAWKVAGVGGEKRFVRCSHFWKIFIYIEST